MNYTETLYKVVIYMETVPQKDEIIPVEITSHSACFKFNYLALIFLHK